MGTTRRPHVDCAENARFFDGNLGQINQTMIMGSCDNLTAPARLLQGCHMVHVQCPQNCMDIEQSLCNNLMAVAMRWVNV